MYDPQLPWRPESGRWKKLPFPAPDGSEVFVSGELLVLTGIDQGNQQRLWTVSLSRWGEPPTSADVVKVEYEWGLYGFTECLCASSGSCRAIHFLKPIPETSSTAVSPE